MLNLYQDSFEGHGATESQSFNSRSVGDKDGMEEDEKTIEVDSGEKEDPCFI